MAPKDRIPEKTLKTDSSSLKVKIPLAPEQILKTIMLENIDQVQEGTQKIITSLNPLEVQKDPISQTNLTLTATEDLREDNKTSEDIKPAQALNYSSNYHPSYAMNTPYHDKEVGSEAISKILPNIGAENYLLEESTAANTFQETTYDSQMAQQFNLDNNIDTLGIFPIERDFTEISSEKSTIGAGGDRRIVADNDLPLAPGIPVAFSNTYSFNENFFIIESNEVFTSFLLGNILSDPQNPNQPNSNIDFDPNPGNANPALKVNSVFNPTFTLEGVDVKELTDFQEVPSEFLPALETSHGPAIAAYNFTLDNAYGTYIIAQDGTLFLRTLSPNLFESLIADKNLVFGATYTVIDTEGLISNPAQIQINVVGYSIPDAVSNHYEFVKKGLDSTEFAYKGDEYSITTFKYKDTESLNIIKDPENSSDPNNGVDSDPEGKELEVNAILNPSLILETKDADPKNIELTRLSSEELKELEVNLKDSSQLKDFKFDILDAYKFDLGKHENGQPFTYTYLFNKDGTVNIISNTTFLLEGLQNNQTLILTANYNDRQIAEAGQTGKISDTASIIIKIGGNALSQNDSYTRPETDIQGQEPIFIGNVLANDKDVNGQTPQALESIISGGQELTVIINEISTSYSLTTVDSTILNNLPHPADVTYLSASSFQYDAASNVSPLPTSYVAYGQNGDVYILPANGDPIFGNLANKDTATIKFNYTIENSSPATALITITGVSPEALDNTYHTSVEILNKAPAGTEISIGNIITDPQDINNGSNVDKDPDGTTLSVKAIVETPALTLNGTTIDGETISETIDLIPVTEGLPNGVLAGYKFIYQGETEIFYVKQNGGIAFSQAGPNLLGGLDLGESFTLSFQYFNENEFGKKSPDPATVKIIIDGNNIPIATDDTFKILAGTIAGESPILVGNILTATNANDQKDNDGLGNRDLSVHSVENVSLKIDTNPISLTSVDPNTLTSPAGIEYLKVYAFQYDGLVTSGPVPTSYLVFASNGNQYIVPANGDKIFANILKDQTIEVKATYTNTDGVAISNPATVTWIIESGNLQPKVEDNNYTESASAVNNDITNGYVIGNIITDPQDADHPNVVDSNPNNSTLVVNNVTTPTFNGTPLTYVSGNLAEGEPVKYQLTYDGKIGFVTIDPTGKVVIQSDDSGFLKNVPFDQDPKIEFSYTTKDGNNISSETLADVTFSVKGEIQITDTSTIGSKTISSPNSVHTETTGKELIKLYLTESQHIDPKQVNGLGLITLANGGSINLDFYGTKAGYNNSLGWYQVDASGHIVDVQLVNGLTNLKGTYTSSNLGDLPAGSQIGLFLIPNGATLNNNYTGFDMTKGHLMFLNPTTQQPSSIADTQAPELYYVPYTSSGQDDLAHKIAVKSAYTAVDGGGLAWHSASSNLNFDNTTHVVSGAVTNNNGNIDFNSSIHDSNTFLFSFEDLSAKGQSDIDYNDAGFVVKVGPGEVSIPLYANIQETINAAPTTQLHSLELTLQADHHMPGDALKLSLNGQTLLSQHPEITVTGLGTDHLIFTGNASASTYNSILQNLQLIFGKDGDNPIGGDRGMDVKITGINGGTYTSSQIIDIGPIAHHQALEFTTNDSLSGDITIGNVFKSGGQLSIDSDYLVKDDNATGALKVYDVSALGIITIAGDSYILKSLDLADGGKNFSTTYNGKILSFDVESDGDVVLHNAETLKGFGKYETAQANLKLAVESPGLDSSHSEVSNYANLTLTIHGYAE